jgi:hypothetical protein
LERDELLPLGLHLAFIVSNSPSRPAMPGRCLPFRAEMSLPTQCGRSQAPGIGDPLLIGLLVSDAMLITRPVEADPGTPRTADDLRFHEVLPSR